MSRRYNFRGVTILIVDDNPFSCQTIMQMCYGFGFDKIMKCNNAADALDLLRTNKVDFVVCDINMKPIDGIEFTRFIRRAPDSTDPLVPIIMLTGNTEGWRVREARDAGATEFVAKPVSAEMLLGRIIHVIETPRPFIDTKVFAGPDRRRKTIAPKGEERRGGKNSERTDDEPKQ